MQREKKKMVIIYFIYLVLAYLEDSWEAIDGKGSVRVSIISLYLILLFSCKIEGGLLYFHLYILVNIK